MSSDLLNYIDKLNIQTYLLSNGQMVIGKLVHAHEPSVEVMSICNVESFIDENDRPDYMIAPLVPHGLEQISIISRAQIVLETPAPIRLKKEYCDLLLSLKVNQVSVNESDVSNELESTLSSLETLKNKDQHKGFGDRWNF